MNIEQAQEQDQWDD